MAVRIPGSIQALWYGHPRLCLINTYLDAILPFQNFVGCTENTVNQSFRHHTNSGRYSFPQMICLRVEFVATANDLRKRITPTISVVSK